MTTLLLVSVPFAMAVGYAAQRGSICAVRGVEQLFESGSSRLLLSFLRCSLWAMIVSLPLVWILPDAATLAPSLAPTASMAVGAFLFGIGAAINGGCSFATVTRLATGEASFALTLIGISLGFMLQRLLVGVSDAIPLDRSLLDEPQGWSAVLLVLLLALAVFELRSLRLRPERSSRTWPPEQAVLVMGVAGGVLYVLHGSWMYTVALDRGLSHRAANL